MSDVLKDEDIKTTWRAGEATGPVMETAPDTTDPDTSDVDGTDTDTDTTDPGGSDTDSQDS
jgi:hypothetical protein